VTRRPIHPPLGFGEPVVVQHQSLPDRPLVSIGPESDVWAEGLLPAVELAYGIVWLKPPPGIIPEKLQQLVAVLKEKGAHVKLLPPDRVDEVVTEARPEAAPELGLQDARETVYQLCRELAPRAGIDPEDAIREAETYLSAAGL
jgi:hypothetical protein